MARIDAADGNLRDDKGVLLPLEDFAGVLAVTFESLHHTRLGSASVKLSNGHFLSIVSNSVLKLLNQIRLTTPEACFDSTTSALDFVISNKTPVAVSRTVRHGKNRAEAFWSYQII